MTISPHILVHLPYFAAVADTGSFTAAAAVMNITQAAMSYQIKQLETKLNTTLVIRNSGSFLSMTSAGQTLVTEYRQCAKRLGIVLDGLRHGDGLGELRLSAPLDLGSLLIPKVLVALKYIAPQLSVKLHVSDDIVDLSTSDWDMAIRSNSPQKTMKSDAIYSCGLCLVGSPQYFTHTAKPERFNDLTDHTILIRDTAKHRSWSTLFAGEGLSIGQCPRTTSLGSTIAIREAAKEGLGLALLPEFVVEDYLATGQLVSCLSAFTKKQRLSFYLARLDLPQLDSYENILRQAFSRVSEG